MKRFKNLIIVSCILVFCLLGIGFIFSNAFYNASDKPSNGIDHSEAGGSRLRNWYFSFNTPDFVGLFNKTKEFVSGVGDKASEEASQLADSMGDKTAKKAKELADETVGGASTEVGLVSETESDVENGEGAND